jgi:hypothetical protein
MAMLVAEMGRALLRPYRRLVFCFAYLADSNRVVTEWKGGWR